MNQENIEKLSYFIEELRLMTNDVNCNEICEQISDDNLSKWTIKWREEMHRNIDGIIDILKGDKKC